MSEIIVLGLVPGTHIQITFVLWLLALTATITYVVVRYARRKRLLRNWLVTTVVLLATRRPAV